MNTDSMSIIRPFFLSWNLRNVTLKPVEFASNEFCLAGTCLGEYPIDAWKRYFLEIPKNEYKKDLTGRAQSAFGLQMKNFDWDTNRIVNLPIYNNYLKSGMNQLKIIINHWFDIFIPEDIPCIAIGVRCHGNYSDIREIQCVNILLIWNDAVCKIITLDWMEGPLEDCITPEWYMYSTSLLNLKNAIEKMQEFSKNELWSNTSYSIYTIPSCIGFKLHGKMEKSKHIPWELEWNYYDYTDLTNDLNFLLIEIQNLFSDYLLESDING